MTRQFPTSDNPLKIGTRGSPLALAQAYETRQRLMAAHGLPEDAFEVVVITTTGDRVQDRALSEIGGKGLFTKEIEEALLSGSIDIAVHSMKDMPVEQPVGLGLSCFLPREDPRDALVSSQYSAISDLAEGAVVGTSSLRRKAQLLYQRPDLKVVEFRGSVQTRLRKLSEGVAEATFLAMAGLNRLDMGQVPATPLAEEAMLPAVAQGCIGIEQRLGDNDAASLLAAINDKTSEQRLAAERAFLAALDGSCQTPIAALAEIDGEQIRLRGEILRPDGSECLADDLSGPVADGAEMGREMARKLLAKAGPNFLVP